MCIRDHGRPPLVAVEIRLIPYVLVMTRCSFDASSTEISAITAYRCILQIHKRSSQT